MTDFLPKDYEMPETERHYMELEEGANSFRVLSPAIVGYEWWVENGEDGRKPVRVRTASEVPEAVTNATDNRQKARHFWAFTVYNYHTQTIQVLELKQQTVMRAIDALVRNPKWGSPLAYDLTIEKVKTGSKDWDVEYNVIPEPPSKLDAGIVELARQVPVRLEALYDGQDPFSGAEEKDATAKARNNHRAERALRFGVLWRKRSLGTASTKGNRWVERILSLKETCRLHARATYAVLVDAVSSFFHSQQPDFSWIN